MNIVTPSLSHIAHLLAAVRGAVAAAVLATALLSPSPALASFPDDPPEPDPDPGTYVAKPDLRVTTSEAVAASSGWQVTYTVKNHGDAASGSFQVAVARDGTGTPATKLEAGLEPQASRNATITIPRSSCYAAFRIVVDAQKVVSEHSEINNETWTVGQAQAVCTDAPTYQVTATELHALRTQEAADEPYLTVSSVSESAATTRSSDPMPGVMAGERVSLASRVGCVWGGSYCAGSRAPHGIGLSVQLFDHDSGDLAAVRAKVAEAFDDAGPISVLLGAPLWVTAATMVMDDAVDTVLAWFDDDEIGSATFAYSPADLARIFRAPGESILQTRALHGGERAGDAFYHLTFRIKRVS